MKIEIFDVEHGQCAMITCPPNGKKLMIDAGHKTMNWWPSVHFHGQPIEMLILTNYDEDHTSDVASVREHCAVNAIRRNMTVNSTRLRQMKAQGGMGPGIQHVYEWMQWTESQPGGAPATVDLGHVVTRSYCNTYGTGIGEFTDANNLSVATFVTYSNFTILFPGDLEVAGWQRLLLNPAFQADLQRTTVLVASHHGRDNGCCEEIFDYCPPKIVIISDAGLQHATQETRGWYANRVPGYQEANGTTRKILSTCYDGKITIDVNTNGFGAVTTERQRNALMQA